MIKLDKFWKNRVSYEESKAKGLIEENCIPICDIFNELGMPTIFCCQGHEDGDLFNIVFESTVGDDEIINFLKFMHDLDPNVTYSGYFSKWYRYHNGVLLINWMYSINGSLEELDGRIKGATRLFRKTADYIKDVASKDPNIHVVYPESK